MLDDSFRMLGPPSPALTVDGLPRLAAEQRQLLTRQQCLRAGMTRKTIEVRLRCGRWTRIYDGVFLTTPGREDWTTLATAAHLAVGPTAAWSHTTAAAIHGLSSRASSAFQLLVDADHAVRSPPGTTVRRCHDLNGRVDPLWWPWVTTIEDTILDIADRSMADETLAIIGRAFQRGLTTPDLLRNRLANRARHSGRSQLLGVLDAGADEAHSGMEIRYLRDVERAHEMPSGERQVRTDPSRRAQHDVGYVAQRVLVELDGRLGHEHR